MIFHEIMSYSVALVLCPVSLQGHRISAIQLTRSGEVSRSNIVQWGQTDMETCLVVLGLGQVGLQIDATLIACYKTCDS